MQHPLVSIISVNYKQTGITCELLNSLEKISYKNIEVIIVDNGSNEDLASLLSIKYPYVKVVVSKKNLGFAGGNNLGIKIASGKYLLFINNDTEVAQDFMEPLIHLLESNSNIGIVSPKIIFFDTDSLIQYAGSDGINAYTGRGAKIGYMQKDTGKYNDIRPTGLAHGAAMIVPFEVIKKVGLMPSLFFLYYEEHDWCEMIKRAGYQIYYGGTSSIFHKESVSVGRESTLKTYYMTRNRLLFMRRNVFGAAFIISILFFIFISIPNNTIKYLLKFKLNHLSAFYKGVFWNLFNYNVHVNERLP